MTYFINEGSGGVSIYLKKCPDTGRILLVDKQGNDIACAYTKVVSSIDDPVKVETTLFVNGWWEDQHTKTTQQQNS